MDTLDAILSCLPVEAEVAQHSVNITFPGLYHVDFSLDGTLSLRSLSRIFEIGRTLALRRYNLGNLSQQLRSGNSVFLRHAQYSLSPELAIPYSQQHSSKHKIAVHLLYCGNTSLGLREILYSEDGSELATVDLRTVFVDKITRKSVSVPPEARFLFPTAAPPSPQGRYSHPEAPQHCYMYPIVVEPHHVDHNQHTNQAMYLQYCRDAECAANAEGFFTKGSEGGFKVTELVTVYNKESMEDDSLVVQLWQDKETSQFLYFSIRLEDNSIFDCRWTIAL